MRTSIFLVLLLVAVAIATFNPFSRGISTSYFAVKVQDGIDAKTVARDHQMIYHGQLGVLPNWHLFDAPVRMLIPAILEKLKMDLRADDRIIDFDQQIRRPVSVKQQSVKFNDPLYPLQWNLNNSGQTGATKNQDINVVPVWNAGVSGKSVLFQIVDNGLEYTNSEFPRYVPAASFNLVTNSKDPSPLSLLDSHGTMVAGVAAAAANNKLCGVGVSYSASVSAINYVGGPNVTDFNTARAQTEWSITTGVDISINSWGTIDSGNTIQRTGSSIANVVEEARQLATNQGRRGRGIVIVWATGNGNLESDNCNLDMLSQSPYIITVAASNANGTWPAYSEQCAANFINAPSSDLPQINLPNIVSASTGKSCTENFGGTSAAAPTVAGAIGLMLDVNANLTYRDVMHILVRTAFQNSPQDPSWTDNYVGIPHSYKYGFGRINTASAVSTARNWTLVPPLTVFRTFKDFPYLPILSNGATFTRVINSEISGTLEQVNLYLNIDHKYPNELTIALISPSGTTSIMTTQFNAGPRPVIYVNETYYVGTYTTFSKIVPTQGISFQGIQVVTANSSCSLTTSLNLAGCAALFVYRSDCNTGDIALQAQNLGANSLWIRSDTTTITGVPGAIIPVFRIDSSLGDAIFAANVGSGQIFHTKVPVYGDFRNNYRMLTVRCWGENPYGRWQLKLIDNTAGDNGLLEDWYLEFFGNLKRVADPVTEIDFFGSSSVNQPSKLLLVLFVIINLWMWL